MLTAGMASPHILVTNDDGITAPSLLALAQAMRRLGKVSVLAPDRNWSASGHVRTIDRPLRVRGVYLADGSPAWACDGAPSDCVVLGACGFLDEKIDLVVSGINPYANIGNDVTSSGTVMEAMEAAICGLPALAVSLDSPTHAREIDYRAACEIAFQVVQAAIRYGIAPNLLLSVNVPFLPLEEIKGIRATRLGLRVYHDRLERGVDPRGQPYFWTSGDSPTGIAECGTDVGALAEGYASVTPLQLDLTAYQAIPDLNGWEWQAEQPALVAQKAPALVE
jgi:5'-nucleotidase